MQIYNTAPSKECRLSLQDHTFRVSKFLQLKKLYRDMQSQILCLEKLSFILVNLLNVVLVKHANTKGLDDNEIQKQQG